MARGLRASNAVLTRDLNGYDHIQEYDPRDKNPSGISGTSGSGLNTAASAATNQDTQPTGSSFAVYFLSGIAGMMVLIAVSYGMILLMTKLGWIRASEEEENANDDAAAEPSWKKITLEERRRVLDKALEAKPHSSFRVAPKTDEMGSLCKDGNDDAKKMKSIDESSSDDSGDDDSSYTESVSSISSITSVGGRYRRSNSRRPDGNQDREMDKTSHIYPEQNETSESHIACSICLEEYQAEDEVIIGISCIHMFHKACAIDWLEKQEMCPCCREQMVCDERMAEATQAILGAERMQMLENGARSNADEFEAEQRIVIPAW